MLDIIPPTNHKHHCIRKGSFCPGHLIAGTVQHSMMKIQLVQLMTIYLAGLLASEDFRVKVAEFFVHFSLLLFHDLIDYFSEWQVVFLDH